MSVRRLFSRGGQNFPEGAGGGGKTILFAQKHLKSYYFPQKSAKKHTIFVGQGGKGPLLPTIADAHAPL